MLNTHMHRQTGTHTDKDVQILAIFKLIAKGFHICVYYMYNRFSRSAGRTQCVALHMLWSFSLMKRTVFFLLPVIQFISYSLHLHSIFSVSIICMYKKH